MFIIVTTVGYYDLFISAVFGHAAGGFGNGFLCRYNVVNGVE